jgi:hypothetical protein
MREAQLEGQPFGTLALSGDGCIRRTTPDGEIVTGKNVGSTVYFCSTENEVGRCEGLKLTVVVVGSHPGKGADFVEGGLIDSTKPRP